MYNGQIIRDLLKERKLKNSDLLSYMGIPNNKSISQLTHGNPTVSRLEKVADYFKVSMDVFFERNIIFNPFTNNVIGSGNNVANYNANLVQELQVKIDALERILTEKDKRIETLEEMVKILRG